MTRQDGKRRREQILEEAERVFAERGYREATLEDIASTLGVRRQALYHYFRSKEEVLLELSERAGGLMHAQNALVIAEDLSPEETLRAVISQHVRTVLSHADLFRVQFEELDRLPGEKGTALRQGQAEYVRRVAAVIADGQERGSFIPGPTTALALLVLGMGNSTLRWYDGDHLSIDELATLAATTAVSGVSNR